MGPVKQIYLDDEGLWLSVQEEWTPQIVPLIVELLATCYNLFASSPTHAHRERNSSVG